MRVLASFPYARLANEPCNSNNLPPDLHAPLYPILAALFERFVPLFERVLTDLSDPPKRRIPLEGGAWDWYKEEEPNSADEDDDDSDEDWRETQFLTLPSPGKFVEPVEGARKEFKIRGKTVQVIVKLANIVLSPEQPEYGGGVWHVEGMRDEAIVASGIYYYDQENVAESSLAFRGSFSEEEVMVRIFCVLRTCEGKLTFSSRSLLSTTKAITAALKLSLESKSASPPPSRSPTDPASSGEPCVQEFNSLSTSPSRCIAFPNIYQHRVSPFSLLDPTLPGHRKILVFFLVEPTHRIPSTTEVGPQQLEWAEREVWKERNEGCELPVLPPEMWDKVLRETGLWSLEEAKKVREELMLERKYFVEEQQEELFE